MNEFESISYAMRVAIAKKVSKILKDRRDIDNMSSKELEEYMLINEDEIKKILKSYR